MQLDYFSAFDGLILIFESQNDVDHRIDEYESQDADRNPKRGSLGEVVNHGSDAQLR